MGAVLALGACAPQEPAVPVVWVVTAEEAVLDDFVDVQMVALHVDEFLGPVGVHAYEQGSLPEGEPPVGIATVALASNWPRAGEGIGEAYGADAAFVYVDRIEEFLEALEPGDRALAVARILAHEIGHCYGLPHRDGSPVMDCCDLPYLEPTSVGFLPEEVDAILEALGQ